MTMLWGGRSGIRIPSLAIDVYHLIMVKIVSTSFSMDSRVFSTGGKDGRDLKLTSPPSLICILRLKAVPVLRYFFHDLDADNFAYLCSFDTLGTTEQSHGFTSVKTNLKLIILCAPQVYVTYSAPTEFQFASAHKPANM
jgi:hypothetical protein